MDPMQKVNSVSYEFQLLGRLCCVCRDQRLTSAVFRCSPPFFPRETSFSLNLELTTVAVLLTSRPDGIYLSYTGDRGICHLTQLLMWILGVFNSVSRACTVSTQVSTEPSPRHHVWLIFIVCLSVLIVTTLLPRLLEL